MIGFQNGFKNKMFGINYASSVRTLKCRFLKKIFNQICNLTYAGMSNNLYLARCWLTSCTDNGVCLNSLWVGTYRRHYIILFYMFTMYSENSICYRIYRY